MTETKKDYPVLARLDLSLIKRLEAYRGKQAGTAIPSRSGVIRAAVDKYLKDQGA